MAFLYSAGENCRGLSVEEALADGHDRVRDLAAREHRSGERDAEPARGELLRQLFFADRDAQPLRLREQQLPLDQAIHDLLLPLLVLRVVLGAPCDQLVGGPEVVALDAAAEDLAGALRPGLELVRAAAGLEVDDEDDGDGDDCQPAEKGCRAVHVGGSV
jgi:hypothetical protein